MNPQRQKNKTCNIVYIYLINSICATFLWVYFISSGFHSPGILDGYYELQAHALTQGQLSIIPGPHEKFYHDVSMYNGKYYFYWGMLPSLVYSVLLPLFGRIASSYIVVFCFLFSFIYFFQRIIGDIIDTALTDNVQNRFLWHTISLPLLWIFIFNLPFTSLKSQWFFGRFAIYEQQIVFGLSIAMPGIFLLIRGARRQNTVLIYSAVFLFSLASWARGTWLPFACLSIPAAFLLSWHFSIGNNNQIIYLKELMWLIPSIALIFGLLLMNYIRFDSFFDFGLKHQNSMIYEYLRTAVGIFSIKAKIWNGIFNLCSYYGSPAIINRLGLGEKSFSLWESLPPIFFARNPQFILIFLLFPFSMYRAAKNNRNILVLAIIIGTIVLYGSMIIAIWQFVIMRFFIEFYYFILLFFFITVVALIPYRFALLTMFLLLLVHIPGNVELFINTKPEIRLVDPSQNFNTIHDKKRQGLPKTFFVYDSVVWHLGTVSFDALSRFKKYNTIGIYPGFHKSLLGKDVSAVYIIPRVMTKRPLRRGALKIKGLRSFHQDGKIMFFLDGSYERSVEINTAEFTDFSFFIDKVIQDVPYQILMIFIPKNREYLQERVAKRPSFVFKEISLERGDQPRRYG